MNKGIFKTLLPHIIAIAVFLIVALIYCSPVLQGDVLQQHDIVQWQAMAKNSFDYKETHGHFPLWTNNLFSGMPGYQIAMDANTLTPPQAIYHLITLFLPKPISLFFLASLCFYFLTQVLRVNPYAGMFTALAYAYATYNPVIIVAGHVTKMQTIALMPALIGSLLLVYDHRRYWLGLALTAVSGVLLVAMNHPQIVYYTFIIAAFMTVAYMIVWIRSGALRHLGLSLGIVVIAAVLSVLSNAVPLFTTYEYSKDTIRGGSELADKNSNSTKTGLSENYAFSYSMKKPEPFVMMVPNMYGGSGEAIEQKLETSKAMEVLQAMPPELANQIAGVRTAYWGGIGYTSGPPYVGAIICFLALLGFVLLDSRHKWWILATCALTIMMSWGSFFEGFNHTLLNVLPMYNKFRAPSMIIVVPTLLLCMMAAMTLNRIMLSEKTNELWERYKKGLYLVGGVLLVLLLIYFSADYTSEEDKGMLANLNAAPEQVREYVRNFLNALKDDRKELFFSSLTRTILFIALAAFVVFLSIRRTLKGLTPVIIIGLLAFIDIISIDVKYMNKEQFVPAEEYENNFVATQSDQQIMQDKGYYRVFDVRQGLGVALGLQGALPSYFHKSIGGYHPAKLSIYQDLIEHQLMKFPQSMPVVNMLNTKYIIQADQQGKESVYMNPDALGPAWFVNAVRYEAGPREVMNALNDFHPGDTAVLFLADQKQVSFQPSADSTDRIELVKNENDEASYKSHASVHRFAVFSEVFYDKGWKAYIDGKESPILRTNYVLRGLSVPAGDHEIKFVFRPSSYYTGQTIASIANVLVWLILLFAIFTWYRTEKKLQVRNG